MAYISKVRVVKKGDVIKVKAAANSEDKEILKGEVYKAVVLDVGEYIVLDVLDEDIGYSLHKDCAFFNLPVGQLCWEIV